jgi:serine/threonine-protein kinase
MAYYEGETLRERAARGPVPLTEAIELGVQLARGLGAAHRRGIVHRDVKPENLVVTGDGVLKIVDFGVATVVREGRPSAGGTFGTAAYMSPEQVGAGAVDRRTDVWSAGVVLYELLAGSRPFHGEGEALSRSIRGDPPRPLGRIRPDLPRPVADLVHRCLEKEPDARFQTAELLATELLHAAEGGAAVPRVVPQRSRLFEGRPRRVLVAVLLLLSVAALYAVLGGPGRTFSRQPAADGATLLGIAVLPFDVQGAGLGIWREGMVDLLSANLDAVAGLRAIDSRTVLARWREEVREAGALDLEKALEVARGTGARYAVVGTVVSSGSGMRLGARIHSLQDERSLASLHVEGSPDSVFALVDRLSIDVIAAIWQGKERPRGKVDLARITTASLPALKAYLEGERRTPRSHSPCITWVWPMPGRRMGRRVTSGS